MLVSFVKYLSSLLNKNFTFTFLLLSLFMRTCALIEDTYNENRPYEFSFNIVDFQHRYEKKDIDGIITGEYGFITADGVYHETGYATDKNGDFIITKMRNRKITSLKDAREIFKDKPEAAKKLFEVVTKACSGCKIPTNKSTEVNHNEILPKDAEPLIENKIIKPILKEMMKVLTENRKKTEKVLSNNSMKENNRTSLTKKNETFQYINRIPIDKKEDERMERVVKEMMINSIKRIISNDTKKNEIILKNSSLEKMANDLYYRFNYSISSHGHQETGYRNGDKNGNYRSWSESGVDTRVKYVSNKFGHQPNITFHPQLNETKKKDQSLKGYSFLWIIMRDSTILLSIIGLIVLSIAYVSAETQDEGEGSTLECIFQDNIGNCLRKRLARDIDRIEIEVSGKKSEPPMSEVIEQTGNFIAEFVSDVQEELQEDEEEIAEREAGVDGRALEEARRKKYGKKKKKHMQKLMALAMMFKAKLALLLQIISTHLQIKLFVIAVVSFIMNATKFWIDLKKNHQPSKVIYYEHAQHQHHYDHEDDHHGGYWGRSSNDSPQDIVYSSYVPQE
ncbi:protein lethal(3)malignant blood neoplasm 1 [Vespula maculifrons]